MKTLTLKLIETGEKPKEGNLVIHHELGVQIITKIINPNTIMLTGRCPDLLTQSFKVVLPYGLSDEEIKLGDKVIHISSNTIINVNNEAAISPINRTEYYKKVELLPEHFNYQQLVELGLKDGDQLNWDDKDGEFDALNFFFEDKAIISRFTPDLPKGADKQKTYTEEEVINLIRYVCIFLP